MTRPRIFLLGVVALGVVAFFLVTWRSAIPPAPRSGPATFPPERIAKGEILAAEGHCASCHTAPGGQPYAGGYPMKTPFGVIYGTNITPDPDTGIGFYSLEAFTRAMREGVRRDGAHLYPAFPYYAFTRLSDGDVAALYAYLMSRPPVRAECPRDTLPFPLSVRALQGGWKLLFFRPGRLPPDPRKSDEWNRGAYLAEAVADCSGCHTPRNPLGAERARAPYAGATVEGWIAPALTAANPSPIPWTRDELFAYLRTGATALHGATAATMTDAIRDALGSPKVPESDLRALAAYFSDLSHVSAPADRIEAATRAALETSARGLGDEEDAGAVVYAGACIGCHYNAAPAPLAARPELALSSALTLSEPTNLIQAVLRGVGANEGAPGLAMPAYASSLSDGEIAALAAYLRRTRTQLPPWTGLEKKIARARRDLGGLN
jgi:mono/diheme cytochrome c family protein